MKYIYFQRIRLLKNKIAAELRNSTKATKNINPFDELGCEIYRTGPTSAEEPTNATIDYDLGDDYKEVKHNGVFYYRIVFNGQTLLAL